MTSQTDFAEQGHSTLERLEDAPPESAAELILTGLRLVRQERSWESHTLQRELGNALRRKLHFTEDQVVEMIELVSVQYMEFPFKGILKAAQSVPMTPRLCPYPRMPAPVHYRVSGWCRSARSSRPH